jgi:hypothetical protein
VEVVARSGDVVLIADGVAGALLHPDGGAYVGPLAVLAGHGQWRASDEQIPAYAPPDLADRLTAKKAEMGAATRGRT